MRLADSASVVKNIFTLFNAWVDKVFAFRTQVML